MNKSEIFFFGRPNMAATRRRTAHYVSFKGKERKNKINRYTVPKGRKNKFDIVMRRHTQTSPAEFELEGFFLVQDRRIEGGFLLV